MEIHYVNTALGMLADRFGLQKTPDSIRMAEVAQGCQIPGRRCGQDQRLR